MKKLYLLSGLLLLSSVTIAQNDTKGSLGIGVYPGDQEENFSPIMQPSDKYRNIALNRLAFSSSAYDYNQTAQLVTDGIIEKKQPIYMVVNTPAGKMSRRESEWAIDGGPYSRNVLLGPDTYIQYEWHGMTISVDKIKIVGTMAYDDKKPTKGYTLSFQVSDDGKKWTTIGELSGKGLPGKPLGYKVQSDPNKQEDKDMLPARTLDESISLNYGKPFTKLRFVMKMDGAVHWDINELHPYNKQGEELQLMTSSSFSSTWMSEDARQQWLYVDLGSKSNISSVNLYWLHKANKGQVEISDDASHWVKIASLPGGKGKIDKISCKGEGRYVRILMNEADNFGHFVLSELEVMGTGGLIAKPHKVAGIRDSRFDLSGGNWQLCRASEIMETGEALSTPTSSFDNSKWIIATVPGTVLTSFVNIGAVPSPNYADDVDQISESYFCSDFWYRNVFEIPNTFNNKRLFLNLDGINWKAIIYLNGKRLDEMSGAFIRGKFDVTDYVKAGKNCLAIRIIKNEHYGAVKQKNAITTQYNGGLLGADNPTFHPSIGWDWITTVRGRNMGIWNDVYLTSKGDVTVSDPYIETSLALPDTTATITPRVILKNNAQKSISGILSGWIGNIKFEKSVTLNANSENEYAFSPNEYKQLYKQNMRLWWPNGYGEPYLYDAGFVFTADGEISDSIHYKAGIREMSYKDVATKLKMYVNGKRFIALGGNWGMDEHNLNYRSREYNISVGYHKQMNFTMIRNWVGQIGDESFYDACDRNGIMVWQDFWLANPADGPDPYDNTMFLKNANDYIKRIRNHASIGLYCGRNEGYPPAVIDKTLREDLKILSPGIVYISSSADDGVSGHGPYNARPIKEYFEKQTGKFHSERGMPNIVTFESLKRMMDSDNLWPQTDQWGQHDYTLDGAQRARSFNELVENAFGKVNDAKAFTEHAQLINYNGYRAMYESCSRDRMGLLIWMSHSCWPNLVFQTYDYYFETNGGFFGAKKACEPLHIQWNALSDSVEVVNTFHENENNVKAVASVIDINGKSLWTNEKTVYSAIDTTVPCFKMEIPNEITDVYFIKLSLVSENGKTISDNIYIRGKVDGNYQQLNTLKKAKLSIKPINEECDKITVKRIVTLRNTSDVPAVLIRLNMLASDNEQILPMDYSDNYFSLMPGEEKTVCLKWNVADMRNCDATLKVSGINVDE